MKPCDYCKGNYEEGALKCLNCGAPTGGEDLHFNDYRACPYCRRKLLALASPACNYCGRRLPDEYIEARKSDLNRIMEIEVGDNSEIRGDLPGRGARRKRGQSASHIDLIDLTILTDLFS